MVTNLSALHILGIWLKTHGIELKTWAVAGEAQESCRAENTIVKLCEMKNLWHAWLHCPHSHGCFSSPFPSLLPSLGSSSFSLCWETGIPPRHCCSASGLSPRCPRGSGSTRGSSHQNHMALGGSEQPLSLPGRARDKHPAGKTGACYHHTHAWEDGKMAPFTVILPFSHFRVLSFAGTLSRLYLSE